ncbi:hypothetical protein ThidrDRAFT_2017 [Thiorhodococcus drewsii AZ1]|uniref:Uncharacterized protein n=1 Tax=Thiorhodococcus drewsii AZ1 TaxID=765913 RepID=G2E154_9GAMM|nr:hypothetical protein [Thiorhodococcus drewsii]EGV31395.1 hypothetical protein ThidrDRAFT_2017 [Thiorhodococcus drewsii AZ1]
MDDDAFRDTYRALDQRVCAFEKSLLTRQASCSLAERFCIAEREGVHCSSETAQDSCRDLLERLHQEARFLTRSTAPAGSRPHRLVLRVQVGGLRGIASVLNEDVSEDPAPKPPFIEDVKATLDAARARFGGLDRLPFSIIMRQIAAYRDRVRPRCSSSPGDSTE